MNKWLRSIMFAAGFIFWVSLSAGAEKISLVRLPLDFSMSDFQLRVNQVAYGWKLMRWEEWLKRPESGPLYISTDYSKKNLEVFQTKSVAIVRRPIGHFSQGYLHNIQTVRKLNPRNQHTQVAGSRFTVETVVFFPKTWSDVIFVGKATKILAEDTDNYLKIRSTFGYANKESIRSSMALRQTTDILNISGLPVDVINLQSSTEINQIAKFISMVTLFQPIDASHTLVVNYSAMALKKHILDLGINAPGVELNGRSVLLGQSSVFNSSTGVGAGLPRYFAEMFAYMVYGFEH